MNYLQLCNRVLRRINEVELTSSGFSSTSLQPPQAMVKDAVNDALHDIHTGELQWPFKHSTVTFSCTSGTGQYALSSIASNLAHFDINRFNLTKNIPDSTVLSKVITPITLENYWDNYKENDDNATSAGYGVPDFVYKTQDEKIGITPLPNKAYQISFQYWKKFVELSAYSDEPDVPERYHHVIIDGAMMYAYLYREDYQQSKGQEQKFMKGIQRMRLELIPQTEAFTRA